MAAKLSLTMTGTGSATAGGAAAGGATERAQAVKKASDAPLHRKSRSRTPLDPLQVRGNPVPSWRLISSFCLQEGTGINWRVRDVTLL